MRRGGVAAVRWSLRITIAATASFIVALLIFPGTQPLLAPLTAMLVVQVTPLSLLASGLDRIVAVVSGVGLAVAFAAVVPLRWWSLGALIFVAITIGQYLRLRSNLMEVAISAMLVLGVGSIGAESFAGQRIAETLVGAAVGVLVTLVFPPAIATSDAGRAIDGLADDLSSLLIRAADELDALAGVDHAQLPGATREWLDDARMINHGIPQIGATLLRVEESRQLNVRKAGAPLVEPGLRQGMEALEHSAVAVRVMMRALADVSRGEWRDRDDAADVLRSVARTLRAMGGGIDAFGELVRNEADVQTQLSRTDVDRLAAARDRMIVAREHHVAALRTEHDPDVISLHAEARANLTRVVRELDLDERLRRQLRLLRPRRPHRTRRPTATRPDIGPDADTQVLPRMRRPSAPPGEPRE